MSTITNGCSNSEKTTKNLILNAAIGFQYHFYVLKKLYYISDKRKPLASRNGFAQ